MSLDEISVFNKVFEMEELIPRNKKGDKETEGYKLKNLSFYFSDTKSIANVCKNIVKIRNGENLASQYTNVLKKMALIDQNHKITVFGNQLLKILFFDNNRILKELNKSNLNISSLSEDIPYTIEFFLYIVVMRCLTEPALRDVNRIDYKNLAFEPISNLEYFFSNIVDTIEERSNKIDDLTDYFGMDKEEFYYFLQGINFNGYEIKRFIKLSDVEKKLIMKAYNRVITCSTIPSKSSLPFNNIDMVLDNGTKYLFSEDEKRYRSLLHYYKCSTQKDIRFRIKHSIINYILFNSLRVQNNKIKLVKHEKLNKIMKFEVLLDIFEKNDLYGIANLVYFNKESKYLKHEFKFFFIDDFSKIDTNMKQITEPKYDYDKRTINLEDKIIIKQMNKENFYNYTCQVTNIDIVNDVVILTFKEINKINFEKIDILKNYIGG